MLWSRCRSSHRRCSVRKVVLRNFAKFTGKSLCQIIFLIRLQAWGLAQVLSCEFCKIFKNLFYRTLPVATSTCEFCKIFKNLFYRANLGDCSCTCNELLFLILESVSMIIVLICCKNMTIIFSKSVSDFLFVQIVSYCTGKKHLKKYFIWQC